MPVRRLTRGLRFQLTASYGLFFTLLILALALFFRAELGSTVTDENTANLSEDWGWLKDFLRLEHGKIIWHYEYDDPDETAIGSRLKSLDLILDDHGTVLDQSPSFESLKIGGPKRILNDIQKGITTWEARDEDGNLYSIRGGIWKDSFDADRRYYVAIAHSIENSNKLVRQFTLLCWGVIPLVIVAGCCLGWINAGRALSPVMEVARTAQRISGSNLSMRIPARGARDELDYLINTFNQMIGRLETSFNQMRQFSIDVSHELRTPITIIRGQMEVALFTAQTSEQYRDAIVSSLQDIERLSQIVRALVAAFTS